MPKRIFFIGHRNAPASLLPVLSDAIVRHAFLSENVELIIGQYGAFDRMAAKSALQLKKHRPSLHLTLLYPYHPSFRKIELPVEFDSLYYPFDRSIPPRAAIVAANIHMIEPVMSCSFTLLTRVNPAIFSITRRKLLKRKFLSSKTSLTPILTTHPFCAYNIIKMILHG